MRIGYFLQKNFTLLDTKTPLDCRGGVSVFLFLFSIAGFLYPKGTSFGAPTQE
jgi:hypothetical protein